MAKKKKKLKTLPAIWQVPDELWNKIQAIIQQYDPPKHTGRKRIDLRAALDAIIFRMRTGCQWNSRHRPRIHRRIYAWTRPMIIRLDGKG